MLGNDNRGAPFIKIDNDAVAVECLVCDESVEFETVNQRWHVHAVKALAGHQAKAHQIAQSIRQRENLRRHAAFRAPYGLALSPPFAP